METDSYIKLEVESQQLISAEEANHFKIIPAKFSSNKYEFYIDEAFYSESLRKELELLYNVEVILIPYESHQINKTLSVYFRTSKDNAETESYLEEDNESFVDTLIIDAKRIGASDIHIEIFEEIVRIRIRIDGKLIEKFKLDKNDYAEMVNQIKIKSKLDITEKRLPQDGRINYSDFDVRVSILPTHYGEKIVMRILGRDASHLKIQDLGFEKKDLEKYIHAVTRPHGLILISGPTGSGKTTTLYATLKHINRIDKNILTVEDPIEYTLDGINQVQLKENIGLNFTSTLKSFLRQDPDVIMLGEIRDPSTAEMAIRASLTGHLVFSTIHTNSAWGTISRLKDMGIPSFLIAETLNLSLAQRLVRKLCPNCKEEVKLDEILLPENFRQKDISINKHYLPKGCESCFYSGYSGRRAIYEILPIEGEVINLIKKEEYNKLENSNIERLSDQAFKMFANGETSLEEVYPILIHN